MVDKTTSPTTQTEKQRERTTIGLVITGTSEVWEQQPWQGAEDAARERDVNLLVFAGRGLKAEYNFGVHANAIYALMSPERVDGFVTGGAFGTYVAPEVARDFCERYRPLPVVTFEQAISGFPGVLLDDYHSMRQVIAHLIEVHGCRRIAYTGEVSSIHAGFRERYRAYVETLQAYGLPFDPNLVYSWVRDQDNEAGLSKWSEEVISDIDALTGQEDTLVLSGLRVLQSLGVRVPGDVAVAAFNDLRESGVATPPLTTMRPPFYEMARRATEILLAHLAGERVPEQEALVGQLIVRQSCGCTDPMVAQVAVGPVERTGEVSDMALAARRDEILAEMAQAEVPTAGVDPGWLGRLLDTFVAALTAGSPESSGLFLQELDDVLRQTMAAGGDVAVLHGALSALRRNTLPYLDGEALSLAEDLWQQARVMIGQTVARAQAYQALQAEQRAEVLREIGGALITTFDVEGLMDVLAEQLPGLGIPSCYLSLYEDPQPYEYPLPAPEWSRLVLAYSDVDTPVLSGVEGSYPGGRIELEPGGRRFRSRELIPEGIWPQRRRYSFIVEPLHFREHQLGFVLFEVGPREGAVYEALRGQISIGLRGAQLVQQLEERSRTLQRRAIQLETSAEVGQVITSIFDIDELFRQTITLIRDRFGFYHAGLFLLDEIGEWAVLQEATGEAGARMKEEGHRLAVDETSMVGWTAVHRQARIALDVGEDAVRFDNPLLPDTHSEMTLPLMVGERVLGVLNVQSTEKSAFDEDDVRTLQSMANQISIAIENARRVADEAALLEATSPVYRTSRLLTTATTTTEVADAIIASVGETGADGCLVVEFEFSPAGEPEALLYLGVWRRDREPQFQAGLRLPIAESPFPLEMVSTLWTVPDVDQDDRLPRSARVVFQATGAKALVNIPLRSGERVIGQVVVIRATPGPFSEAALRLYEVLSDQAAVALERAELLEEAQQRAEREQQTRRMIDRIRRAVDLEQALGVAAEELSRAMEVPHVSINLSVDASGRE